MSTETQTALGTDIKVNDTIFFLGKGHLITEIASYDGPFDFIGVAKDATGWGISLEASGRYEIGRRVA